MNTPENRKNKSKDRQDTRLIALGSAVLMQGFRLIGFEVYADATPDQVEELLRELLKKRHKAFIVMEQSYFRSDLPMLKRVRTQGGRIVVVEVPALEEHEEYHPPVDDLIRRLFGPSMLEQET